MDTRVIIEDLLAVVPDSVAYFEGISGGTAADLELWLPTIPSAAALIPILDGEMSRLHAVALARRAGVVVSDKEKNRTRILERWLEARGATPTRRPRLCAQELTKKVYEKALQASANPDDAYGIGKTIAPETERLARAVARYYLDRCGSAGDRVARLSPVINEDLGEKLRRKLRRPWEEVAADGAVDRILEEISLGTLALLLKGLLESTPVGADAEVKESAACFAELASPRNDFSHGLATPEHGRLLCSLVHRSFPSWLRRHVVPRGALVREVIARDFGTLVWADDEHGVSVELSGGLTSDTLVVGDSLLIEPHPGKVRISGSGVRPLPKKGAKQGAWWSPGADTCPL
jgi:hypothetical protein